MDQLHGSFSDNGAHQDLQKPNFAMPELILKELWYPRPPPMNILLSECLFTFNTNQLQEWQPQIKYEYRLTIDMVSSEYFMMYISQT